MTKPTIEKENIISHLQFFVIISRIVLSGALFGVYREVSEKAGRDSWISFIIAGLIILLASLIILSLNKRFPGYTFVEYAEFIVGKWIGKALGVLLILLFLSVSALLLRLFGEMVSIWLLRQTPLYIIISISLTLIIYLSRNGLLVLGRFCTLITFIIMPLYFFIFIPMPVWDVNNILPIGSAGFTNIIAGILPSIFAFGGYEAILMLYPYVQNKSRIQRTTFLTILYSVVIYTTFMIALILYFGPQEIMFVLFPPLVYLTTVEIPIIIRMDAFIFFFGMFSIIAGVGALYFFTSLGIAQLLNIKNRKNITLWIAPLVLGIALYPKDLVALIDLYGSISIANVAIGIGMPSVLLFIAIILKRRKETDNEGT